jgi:hypothetical protein
MAGRKKGSKMVNNIRTVYRLMRKDKAIDMSCTELSTLLNTVADKIWARVYAGNTVAVPYLFNMEVVPTKQKWVRGIDWKRTNELWKTDAEAKADKLLVRYRPTQYYIKVRHSTISPLRSYWYYSHLLTIRLSKAKACAVNQKYELL